MTCKEQPFVYSFKNYSSISQLSWGQGNKHMIQFYKLLQYYLKVYVFLFVKGNWNRYQWSLQVRLWNFLKFEIEQ